MPEQSREEVTYAARDQFDRRAAAYAQSVPHSSSASLQIIEKLASERRYRRGLDIATGPGFTAFAVSPYCDEVVASDIAPGMLSQVERLAGERGIGNVATALADAGALPFDDCSFELVTCRTAPHHFPDIDLFLAEARRVLATDGTFLIADTCTSENSEAAAWHNEMEKRRDDSHNRCLPPSEWLERLGRAGLESDFDTMTRVNMQFDSWTERSATPADERESLRRDWAATPDLPAAEFRVKPVGGGDFSFSWPVFVSRSRKRG